MRMASVNTTNPILNKSNQPSKQNLRQKVKLTFLDVLRSTSFQKNKLKDLNSNFNSVNPTSSNSRANISRIKADEKRSLSPIGVVLESNVLRKSPSNNKFTPSSLTNSNICKFPNFPSKFDLKIAKLNLNPTNISKKITVNKTDPTNPLNSSRSNQALINSLVKDLEEARSRVLILEQEKGQIAVDLINTSNGRIEQVHIDKHEDLIEELADLKKELKSVKMENETFKKKNAHLKKKSGKLEEELQLICQEYKVLLNKSKLSSLKSSPSHKELKDKISVRNEVIDTLRDENQLLLDQIGRMNVENKNYHLIVRKYKTDIQNLQNNQFSSIKEEEIEETPVQSSQYGKFFNF